MHLAMCIIRLRNPPGEDWEERNIRTWTDYLKSSTDALELRYNDGDIYEDVKMRQDILASFYDLARYEEEYDFLEEGESIDCTQLGLSEKALHR